MYQTNSFKKKQKEDKYPKKEIVESIFGICEEKGCPYLFHVWKDSNGQWITCRPFRTKISRRLKSVFQRRQCPRTMLPLQHKSGRKPVYIWTEVGRRKSKRTLRPKTKGRKMD